VTDLLDERTSKGQEARESTSLIIQIKATIFMHNYLFLCLKGHISVNGSHRDLIVSNMHSPLQIYCGTGWRWNASPRLSSVKI
jgi:hypothetical protein